MSDNLTPTAQAILDHLRDQPSTTAATAADLRERIGRSRSAIDKALAELARTGLVTKTPDTGDGPTQWSRTDPGTANRPPTDAAQPGETAHPEGRDAAPSAEPGQDDNPAENNPHGSEPTGPDTSPAEGTAPADDEDPPDPADPVTGHALEPMEEVKVCRGCGEQLPKTCPTCWQKTTSYCGTCRKNQPATRRHAPGEPQILANGLPKLLPGQLERLVADIITTQPLPDHLGITGWTPGRVAIFLPGRSTGAIGNALDKLAATGQAQLIGDNPKRYQPTPTDDPATDHPDTPGDADQQQ